MEADLPKVTVWVPSRGAAIPSNLKVHFQFGEMFLQVHQESLYLTVLFQSANFKFLDALDYLWSHPDTVKDVEVTAPATSTSQNHSERSFLSGWGDIFSAIFRGGRSGCYSGATIDIS